MKAIIFDFDGVIVDSKQMHLNAYNQALKSLKIKISKTQFEKYFGVLGSTMLKEIFLKNKIKASPIKYREIKNEIYTTMTNKIKLTKGIKNLLKSLSKYKLCIASSTNIKGIKILVEKYNLNEYFKFIISNKSTIKHKPSAEPYLLAAKKIKEQPKDCVVIEDSPVGIKSAKRAGMKCIAVLTTYKKKDLLNADLIVKDLTQIKKIKDFLEK